MSDDRPAIGILGAGRLGMALARLAARAGYPVLIAGSGEPSRVAVSREAFANGAVAATASDVVEGAAIVILALPLRRFREVPRLALAGKVVIDAMNYWWAADGLLTEFSDPTRSSSEIVQEHLSSSHVVKAFNHMGYTDLEDEARAAGEPHRKAIGIAGDDARDVRLVSGVVDALGFDPVHVGPLAAGIALEPGTEPFGADVEADELRAMIETFPTSQRGRRRAAALSEQNASDAG